MNGALTAWCDGFIFAIPQQYLDSIVSYKIKTYTKGECQCHA
jgi:hypothetical protein